MFLQSFGIRPKSTKYGVFSRIDIGPSLTKPFFLAVFCQQNMNYFDNFIFFLQRWECVLNRPTKINHWFF